MEYKYICPHKKCNKKYNSEFWFRWHFNQHKPWIKVLEIIGIIGFIITLLTISLPFLGWNSIWNYFEGPDFKVEAAYPSVDGIITLNYQNDGGLPLNNIEIRYSFGLDKELNVADLSTRYLENKGDSGFFSINLTKYAQSNCTLMKEIPIVTEFYEPFTLECFFKTDIPLPENVCYPAEIKGSLYSKEIPDGKSFLKYYPVSFPVFKLLLKQSAGKTSICAPWGECTESKEQICKPYIKYEGDKKNLQQLSTSRYIFLNETLGNAFKLSKKYCNEGLMPAKWCVENNLG